MSLLLSIKFRDAIKFTQHIKTIYVTNDPKYIDMMDLQQIIFNNLANGLQTDIDNSESDKSYIITLLQKMQSELYKDSDIDTIQKIDDFKVENKAIIERYCDIILEPFYKINNDDLIIKQTHISLKNLTLNQKYILLHKILIHIFLYFKYNYVST